MLPERPRLLCTDPDRALLPNGAAGEDPSARNALAGAVRATRENGGAARLCVARGSDGFNGNYGSWILEGLAHFRPPTKESIR